MTNRAPLTLSGVTKPSRGNDKSTGMNLLGFIHQQVD